MYTSESSIVTKILFIICLVFFLYLSKCCIDKRKIIVHCVVLGKQTYGKNSLNYRTDLICDDNRLHHEDGIEYYYNHVIGDSVDYRYKLDD